MLVLFNDDVQDRRHLQYQTVFFDRLDLESTKRSIYIYKDAHSALFSVRTFKHIAELKTGHLISVT
jgi:hypothetical protein